MKRRQVFGSIAGAGTAAIAGSRMTMAQDESDLEARVTELEEQMATVLERLDALEGNGSDGDQGDAKDADGGISITGTGNTVSRDFVLEPGRYAATSSAVFAGSVFNFAAWIYAPNDSRDLLVNEIVEADFESEAIYEAPVAGNYFLEVTAGSDWSVTLTPR